MSEWKTIRLMECASFQEGYVNPPQTNPDHFGDEIKWLRANDLNDGYVFDTTRRLSTAGFESAGKSALLFEPDTLAISKSGTIGRIGILKDWMCGNRAVINIKVDKARCNPRFIFYVLLQNRPTVENLAIGSVQKNLYTSALGKLEFQLPPKTIQDEVAHILGTLDDKIELNRRMNETLEAIARALFKSWFVDFDPVRAKMSGEPPESICQRLGLTPDLLTLFPDRLVDSELGEIPEGWRVGTLGDVAQHPRRGIQPSQIATATPYIALEHMPRRCIALSDWDVADDLESNKFEFKKGEILFGKLRPYFHKVGVAPVDGVCSTDIVVITPKTDEWFGFVLGHTSSDAFVEHANAGSTGTKMPRTSWSDMSRYPIVMPSKEIAVAFTNFVRPAIESITASIHEARTLAGLRDALLPQLLSGELRVPDAANLIKEATV